MSQDSGDMALMESPVDDPLVSAQPADLSSEILGKAITISGKKRTPKSSGFTTFLPPCRICNAKASGFHYGANTCEACKAFFRRSLGNEHTIKSCTRGGKCAENPNGKISCSDCRHKKCLAIGMAKEECRRGRYTHEKRTKDTKEIKRMQAQAVETNFIDIDSCEMSLQYLLRAFKDTYTNAYHYMSVKTTIEEEVYKLASSGNFDPPVKLTVLSSGNKSAICTKAEKIFRTTGKDKNQATGTFYENFTADVEATFRSSLLFAKCLPGFSDLPLDDKIRLAKSSRTDITMAIRHQFAFFDIGCVAKYDYTKHEVMLIPRHWIFPSSVGEDYLESQTKTIRRLQQLKLQIEDIAVLLAFLLLAPDREDLQQPNEIEALQLKILPVLQYTLKKNHPTQPNILAEILLIIPMLREHCSLEHAFFSRLREYVNPDDHPYSCDILKE